MALLDNVIRSRAAVSADWDKTKTLDLTEPLTPVAQWLDYTDELRGKSVSYYVAYQTYYEKRVQADIDEQNRIAGNYLATRSDLYDYPLVVPGLGRLKLVEKNNE